MIVRHCSHCGTSADAPDDSDPEGRIGAVPDGWSFSVENKRTTYQCPPCVRANIRAIEGKLTEEWW